MRIDYKALVRRLTPTATRLLEAAVVRAANAKVYEVVPEHYLWALLEPKDGDADRVLAEYGKSRSALLGRVERVLEGLKGGNASRPVLSQALFSWLRDAWLIASVERGASVLRSADLVASFGENVERYSAESYPELESLPHDELRTRLSEIVASSAEAAEARPPSADGEAPKLAVGQAKGQSLERFTISFTERARAGRLDPVLGRQREIRQLIDILSRRRKNNPLIVGEAGVGKTALVEGLAQAIVAGEVPESLREVEIVGLDLGALQAGAGVRGEFEQRLKGVIQEVKASLRPIVLFIDEAHALIGAGGAQGTGDAANLLKPELARGELRTIAATTWSEYKRYFEKDAALERRFQPVKVEQPTEDEAVAILRGLRATYESAHQLVIRDEALVAAARLGHRYISGRQLPDKAVDLLDSAAARVRTEAKAKPEPVAELEAELAALERAREALERDQQSGATIEGEQLERACGELARCRDKLASLRQRWQSEQIAAERVFAARRALAPGGEHGPSRRGSAVDPRALEALQEARAALAELQGEAPLVSTEVDAQAIARVVQSWTGIPVGKLQSRALAQELRLEELLKERIKGQDAAMRVVAEAVRMSSAGIAEPEKPKAVLLFVGTSGVGKTETALALADAIFGGERFLTSIAMSEFQEKHSVSRLIGSPPGYVGYGEGGVLTEAVRRHPYSVVLLDECEKADLEVMNLFYQVFDKGALNDGEGRKIDFRNTVVVLTSNLASDQIAALYRQAPEATPDEVLSAIRPLLSRHFKPALLARMTIVPFAPMNPTVLRNVVELKLDKLRTRVAASHRAQLSFSEAVVHELVARCSESEAGARNVEHVLRGSLLPALARELLSSLSEGRVLRQIAVDAVAGNFEIDLR